LLAGVLMCPKDAVAKPGYAEISTQAESQVAVPAFSHIFLLLLENKEFNRVFRSPGAPYLNALAAEYGLASQYYAVAHPSLPNYLALLGADTFGVASNYRACYQSAASLPDQLEAHGRTWKAYFESIPRACYAGDSPDELYVQKHNPFVYFDAIRQDATRCGRIVPLEELSADLASGDVADFVWIGPNMRSSTHSAPIDTGDRWLAAQLPEVLQSSAFENEGLLVVTYDEGDSDAGCCGRSKGGGHVMTVLASPLGRRGFTSDIPHDHYSLLRTIEDAWDLGYLGHAADPSNANLAEFFAPPRSP